MLASIASRVRESPSTAWRKGIDLDLRDLLALLTLVLATVVLAGQDGGRPLRAMIPTLGVGVLAMIAALPTLRRQPRWLLAALALWFLGPLVSLVFAEVRAGWVRPVAAWTLAGTVFVAATQILQRRWGSAALLLLAGTALGRAWYQGLLVWWAGGTSRGEPAWMALSWHNQSGTLMAVLGVGGLGLALTTAGRVRVTAIVGAVAGLAGAWLSASRGAVAAAVVGVLVVAVGAMRRGMDRRTYLTLASVMLATVALTVALSAMWGNALGDTSRSLESAPITSREQDAVGNLRARVGHWEAAIRMFAAHPLTGTGPGSYRWSSIPVYPEDTNLTSSAHGEQLEALGEQGLLGGGIAMLATLGLAWLVLHSLARPSRRRVELAACGALTVLLSHAALDFDWDYALLFSLTSLAAALLLDVRSDQLGSSGNHPRTGERRRTQELAVLVVVGAALASTTSLIGIHVQTRSEAPWSLLGRLTNAVEVAAEDRGEAARQLSLVRRWNPGVPGLSEVEALIARAAGDISDLDLMHAIDAERSPEVDQLQAARQLLDAGSPALAVDILTDLQPVLDRRRAWGVSELVATNAGLQLAAVYEEAGCPGVDGRIAGLKDWGTDHGVELQQFERSDVWKNCLDG